LNGQYTVLIKIRVDNVIINPDKGDTAHKQNGKSMVENELFLEMVCYIIPKTISFGYFRLIWLVLVVKQNIFDFLHCKKNWSNKSVILSA